MKKQTGWVVGVTLILFTSLGLLGGPAEAKERHSRHHASLEQITLQQAAAESSDETSHFGLGFSTYSGALSTNVFPSFSSAITGILEFSSKDSLQVFFSLPRTDGGLALGGAGLYKRTISQGQNAGFHVGGGLGMATTNGTFGLSITAIGGFHFNLPGVSKVQVHLDGGPSFTLQNSTPSRTDFSLAALSPAFGASILYRF